MSNTQRIPGTISGTQTGAGLESIRFQVVPQMEAMARAQVFEVEDAEMASDADGVYGAYGPLEKLSNVPAEIVAAQLNMHARLNSLVRRLGDMADVRMLFDPSLKLDIHLFKESYGMSAGLETNTHKDAKNNGGTIARATFQYIPAGIPVVKIPMDDGTETEIEEYASLDIMRSSSEEGERWLEVVASRTLQSRLAMYGHETSRRATLYFDPRTPEEVLPYVALKRSDENSGRLAVAGSAAWNTGLTAIHDTIDLVEAAPWPTNKR